ncbi:MAG TPA: flippase-like domain-containing protein [Phycisphaerales bacterium]|nr:flippase-like domain-containing protein [Phycisphaerales bacterium]
MNNVKARIRQYKKIFQWILAFVCLCYIVLFFCKNRDSLKVIFSLDFVAIAYLVLFYTIGLILQCYRYVVVIRKCSGSKIPFIRWFRIFILGTFLSKIIPQAGNIYRSVCLKKDFHVSYTSYISSYVSFAWLDTTLNLIIALIVVLIFNPSLRIGNLKAYHLILFLAVLAAVIPFTLNIICTFLESRIKYFSWLHSKVSEVLRVSVSNVRDGIYIARIGLTGMLSFINVMIIFYVCFRSLGVQVELPVLTLFFVILKLSNQLVITPGNLGVRELAYGILGELANIGMAQAILASVIFRIVGTILVFALGLLFGGFNLLRKRDNYTCDES